MAESFIFKWPMNQLDGDSNYKHLDNADIFITGDFDNWSKSTQLMPNYKEQYYEVNLPINKFDTQGRFNFKFYFQNDDIWKCSPSYPIEYDDQGNQNNYITGAEMIKQAEEIELERRQNRKYCESEAINEEIINELQVSSSDMEDEINGSNNNIDYKEFETRKDLVERELYEDEQSKAKKDINERLEEIESERSEFHKEFENAKEKKKNSVSESVNDFMNPSNDTDTRKFNKETPAQVSFFPTENETLEEAISKNEEHVPILVHYPEKEDNVINEPVESLIRESPAQQEKTAEEQHQEPGNDTNDIDDIPMENRRKLKIKRKIKKNKKTGERIIVSQEIYELDQDDNIIAVYNSMEEVEKSHPITEQGEPKERLYEIENENENDVDMTSSSSSAVMSPHEEEIDDGDVLPPIKENTHYEDVDDTSEGEEAEIPIVKDLSQSATESNNREKSSEGEEAEIPTVLNGNGDANDNHRDTVITPVDEDVNEEKPEVIPGDTNTTEKNHPVYPSQNSQENVGENVEQPTEAKGEEKTFTQGMKTVLRSQEDEVAMSNEEATVTNETVKDATSKPTPQKRDKQTKKATPIKKTASEKISRTSPEKTKKSGILNKLKRTFF